MKQWWKALAIPEDAMTFLLEISKFLATVALTIITAVLLLMAGCSKEEGEKLGGGPGSPGPCPPPNHLRSNTMGRTVLPYSHVWEEERQRWQKFRRALRREDQAQFDRLFELARLHLQAGVYASNPWPLESMLLSMLLEHEKALSALERRLERLEEQESDNRP